ncbi:MAG: 30S ribosomal protein S16 [Fimbriimonadaceae bacterium]|nr:30S ribosomal protein S16 [Fimbriimonadaceae bacterium]QYK54882.1 MAG: 30S ribosomal protein S16 [Fimbriimonadaceae bacterium]
MVKIRLRRMGNKHRPYYRIVVAKSTAGRNGSFIEVLGTYNPITQPKQIEIKGPRALHWLMTGAQPTETVAYLLKKQGVLDEFFQQRPDSKKDYKFLDKRVAPTTSATVAAADEPAAEAAPEPTAAPESEPVAEAAPEPAAEAAPEPSAEAPAEETAEETPAE